MFDASEIVNRSGPTFGDGGYRPPPPRWRPDALLGTAVLIIDLPISIVVDTLCLPFDIYDEHKKTLAGPKRKIGETTFLIVNPGSNNGLLWTVSNRTDRASLDLLANVGEKKTPPDKRYADVQADVSFDLTGRCWTVVYRATNGTDGIICSNKFLYEAPEAGYQKELVLRCPSREPKYLYLRSRSPAIFSRVLLEHDAWQEPDTGENFRIRYEAWINPYGDRNLEYDDRAEQSWRVKDELTEEAKAEIEAKRLPPKHDIPLRIKTMNARVVREKEESDRRHREWVERQKWPRVCANIFYTERTKDLLRNVKGL